VISRQKNLSAFKRISAGNLVFFLLWPLGNLLFNLKNKNVFEKKTVILLFLTFLGFMFIYGDPNKHYEGSDSGRYAAQFEEFYKQSFSLNQLFESFYNEGSQIVDIYSSLLMWLVSRFTGDPRFLFMLLSFIFGWFYINNIFIVLSSNDVKKYKNNFILKLIITSLILLLPIWFINSFRFWTASHIFIYGLLLIYLMHNRNGYFFIFVSVFVHFSFIYLIFIFLLFKLIPKWNFNLLFWGFIVTSLTSELKLNLPELMNITNLPDFISARTEAYTDEDYVLLLSERTYAWHTTFASAIGRYLPLILLVLFYFSSFNRFNNTSDVNNATSKHFNILLFAILAGTITNIIVGVAELGRFMIILRFLIYIIVILNFAYIRKFKIIFYLLIPLFIFYIIFQIRVGTDHFGPWVLIGNPIIALLVETQTPIIDLFKEFIK